MHAVIPFLLVLLALLGLGVTIWQILPALKRRWQKMLPALKRRWQKMLPILKAFWDRAELPLQWIVIVLAICAAGAAMIISLLVGAGFGFAHGQNSPIERGLGEIVAHFRGGERGALPPLPAGRRRSRPMRALPRLDEL